MSRRPALASAIQRPADPGGEAGFTLIEIVIAILVLTMGVLGLASIMAGTSQRHEQSVSHAELTSSADSKFDDLRAISAAGGADTIQLSVGGSLTENVEDHNDTIVTGVGRSVRRRWAVADGPAGTRSVTIRVQPDDDAAWDHTYLTFQTLIAP